MGEYLTLLTQVKEYLYGGKIALARDTLSRLLNRLNMDYLSATDPAEKEKVRKSLVKLLPVLADLKKGIVSDTVISVLSLDRTRFTTVKPAQNISIAPSADKKPSKEPSKPKIRAGGFNNNVLMPLTLDDYIGQENAKKSLRISINAAKKSGRTLAHLLICSSYGLGKTTLANIIANEMGLPFFNINATNLKDAASLSLYFSKIEESCILFIAEIHTLKKDVQTVLLSIMTDFTVNLLDESGESHSYNVPPFTMIGATTQAGELLKPFINRFAVLELEEYTEDEKKILVESKFKKLGYSADEEAVLDISRRCRGVPRTIETYVKGTIDVALAHDIKTVTREVTREYFDINQIDEMGLTKNDLKLLQALDEADKPLALITLASKLNIQKEDIEFRYEPYLFKIGFIDKTMQGRVITKKGKRYLHPDDDGADDAPPFDIGAEEPPADDVPPLDGGAQDVPPTGGDGSDDIPFVLGDTNTGNDENE